MRSSPATHFRVPEDLRLINHAEEVTNAWIFGYFMHFSQFELLKQHDIEFIVSYFAPSFRSQNTIIRRISPEHVWEVGSQSTEKQCQLLSPPRLKTALPQHTWCICSSKWALNHPRAPSGSYHQLLQYRKIKNKLRWQLRLTMRTISIGFLASTCQHITWKRS